MESARNYQKCFRSVTWGGGASCNRISNGANLLRVLLTAPGPNRNFNYPREEADHDGGNTIQKGVVKNNSPVKGKALRRAGGRVIEKRGRKRPASEDIRRIKFRRMTKDDMESALLSQSSVAKKNNGTAPGISHITKHRKELSLDLLADQKKRRSFRASTISAGGNRNY